LFGEGVVSWFTKVDVGMTPVLTMTVQSHGGDACALSIHGNILEDDDEKESDVCWGRPVCLSLSPGIDVDLSLMQVRMLRDFLTLLLVLPELWHE
jgi:hypothetical protein